MRKVSLLVRSIVSLSFIVGPVAMAQDVPIVQPGAPGQDVRNLTADEAVEIAESSYSPDDV